MQCKIVKCNDPEISQVSPPFSQSIGRRRPTNGTGTRHGPTLLGRFGRAYATPPLRPPLADARLGHGGAFRGLVNISRRRHRHGAAAARSRSPHPHHRGALAPAGAQPAAARGAVLPPRR